MDEKEAEARPVMGTIFLVLVSTIPLSYTYSISKKCFIERLNYSGEH